jgi:hypothetical protein
VGSRVVVGGFLKEKMKKVKKSLKKYFDKIKIFLIIIFIISIIQIALTILKISVPKILGISLISLFKILFLIFTGFYLVLKEKFNLKKDMLSGIIFFICEVLVIFTPPSLFPEKMQLVFKIINYSVILIANFIIFILASVLGGILALLYKRFFKQKYL